MGAGLVAIAAVLKLVSSIAAVNKDEENQMTSVPDSLARRWQAKDIGMEPELTFDPPGSYVGPEVPGWPPGREREMRAYVRPERDTVLIGGDVECGRMREKEVVVFVQSAPQFR